LIDHSRLLLWTECVGIMGGSSLGDGEVVAGGRNALMIGGLNARWFSGFGVEGYCCLQVWEVETRIRIRAVNG
jgi:hypothetical protein